MNTKTQNPPLVTFIAGYSLEYTAEGGGFVSLSRRGKEYGASVGALEGTGELEDFDTGRAIPVPESAQEKILEWEEACFNVYGRC